MGAARQHLVVLVLLSLFQQHLGQFEYMIGPSSYLDVVKRPAGRFNSTERARAYCSATGKGSGQCQEQSSIAVQDADQVKSEMRALLQSSRHVPPYNICVSDWVPMVKCTPDGSQDDFKGYQVELFRMLAKEVGWTEEDYHFSCVDYSGMMADLKSTNGSCSLSATGVEVFPENLAAGIKFSWPTYKSGLKIMIHAELQQGSTWAFSEVFHWTVWLTLGATAVAVGLLVGFIEWATFGNRHNKGWQSWTWYSLAKMMHVFSHVGDPGTDASRILMLGYGFLVLVMVSMYTATSASRITAEKLVHPVHGKEDLIGRKVETWEKYIAPLQTHHHVKAEGKPWEGGSDLDAMIHNLEEDKYDALVLDAPVLDYTVGTNEHCNLFTIGEAFETFSLALAFPADFDDALVFEFSASIVKLQTYQGALDVLENVYVKTGGTSKCFGSGGGHGSGDMIQLRQVSGLWYILLITVGLCFILTIIHNYRNPVTVATLRSLSGQAGMLSGKISRIWNSAPGALGSNSMAAGSASHAGARSVHVGAASRNPSNPDLLSLSGAGPRAVGAAGAAGGVIGSPSGNNTNSQWPAMGGASMHASGNGGGGTPRASSVAGSLAGGTSRSASHAGGASSRFGDEVQKEPSKLKVFLGTTDDAYSSGRHSRSSSDDEDGSGSSEDEEMR